MATCLGSSRRRWALGARSSDGTDETTIVGSSLAAHPAAPGEGDPTVQAHTDQLQSPVPWTTGRPAVRSAYPPARRLPMAYPPAETPAKRAAGPPCAARRVLS